MAEQRSKVVNKLTNRVVFEGPIEECKQMVISDKTGFLDLQ